MKNSKRNTKGISGSASLTASGATSLPRQDSEQVTASGAVLFSATKKHQTAIIKILKRGGVGVLPTDTLYGLVGSALQPKTVARIYRLRKRNPQKPLIVLIGRISDLKIFRIPLNPKRYSLIANLWPDKISIVLPCSSPKFRYLHRGTKSIAFRLPAKKSLRALLRKTGPLVAPSANFEGQPPAKTISEAKKYFGDKTDFYVNAGILRSKLSTLIAIKDGRIKILRKGAKLNQRMMSLFRKFRVN